MLTMKEVIYRIEKLLRIKRCNGCDRIIWWSKRTLRYIDSPKDEYGYLAPTCEGCRAYAEKHKFDN